MRSHFVIVIALAIALAAAGTARASEEDGHAGVRVYTNADLVPFGEPDSEPGRLVPQTVLDWDDIRAFLDWERARLESERRDDLERARLRGERESRCTERGERSYLLLAPWASYPWRPRHTPAPHAGPGTGPPPGPVAPRGSVLGPRPTPIHARPTLAERGRAPGQPDPGSSR